MYPTNAYQIFIKFHAMQRDDLRLGQRFCVMYITGSWPGLFYCSDPIKSGEMIDRWLKDHCYADALPPITEGYAKLGRPHP